MRVLIRSSTTSMTSVPKPLKFLIPHYDTLKNIHAKIVDQTTKVWYYLSKVITKMIHNDCLWKFDMLHSCRNSAPMLYPCLGWPWARDATVSSIVCKARTRRSGLGDTNTSGGRARSEVTCTCTTVCCPGMFNSCLFAQALDWRSGCRVAGCGGLGRRDARAA